LTNSIRTIADSQISGNGGPSLLEPFRWKRCAAKGVDVLVSGPHRMRFRRGVGCPEAMHRAFKVIDLSGAWRLRRPAIAQYTNLKTMNPALAEKLNGPRPV